MFYKGIVIIGSFKLSKALVLILQRHEVAIKAKVRQHKLRYLDSDTESYSVVQNLKNDMTQKPKTQQ